MFGMGFENPSRFLGSGCDTLLAFFARESTRTISVLPSVTIKFNLTSKIMSLLLNLGYNCDFSQFHVLI